MTLLDATHARLGDANWLNSDQKTHVDLELVGARDALRRLLSVRQGTAGLNADLDAPPHPERWLVAMREPDEDLAARADPLRVTRLARARLGRSESDDTVLVATSTGQLLALNSDGSMRWTHDAQAALNDVVADDLTGDGQDEIVLARQDHHVQVLDVSGQRALGTGTDLLPKAALRESGPHR